MWYLLYGLNDIARDEEVTRLKSHMGDANLAPMNITTFDEQASLKDIQAACDTLSFLSERRMVILHNWVAGRSTGRASTPRRKGESSRSPDTGRRGGSGSTPARVPVQGAGDISDDLNRILLYLPDLPETTTLVFIEDTVLPEVHPLVKLAHDTKSQGHAQSFGLPTNLVQWISERAISKGGSILPQAAQLLAERINQGDKNDRDHFAEDSRLYLRKLDNELDKLVAYAMGRHIESSDVELLVAEEEVSAMFKFIDAISAHDGQQAFHLMRGILARGEQPLVILSMLARQCRLMIIAKESAQLNDDDLSSVLGIGNAWAARKVVQQSRRFTTPQLVQAHTAIMQADLDIKTGRMADIAALDTLVALFCA